MPDTATPSPVLQNLRRNVPIPLIGRPVRLWATVAGEPRVWVIPDVKHVGDYVVMQKHDVPNFPRYEGRYEHVECYVVQGSGTTWHLWKCPPVKEDKEKEAPAALVEGDREVDARARTIERRREAVSRMVGEGKTTREIAEHMGLPETTIRSDRVALKKGG